MNRLVLIDGNAALHRAYHAIPPMRDPAERPVNAVYGFTAMLIKIIADLKPTHIAVAFDRAAPTFRKLLFDGYQSKRPKMDDELSVQIDIVHELLAAFAIPVYEHDGFEADDVIGTIAQKHKEVGQIIIVTGDRDILQLVRDEKVLVYMPTKGLSEGKVYGEADVRERLGVAPTQIPDYKAFAGDQSDNYPGVPGIGPKSAISFIADFGTVENLYKHLDKASKKYSEGVMAKLEAGKKSAFLSKDLATIRTNAPVEFKEKDCRYVSFDTPRVHAELASLSFPSLMKRIEKELGAKKIGKKVAEEKQVSEDTQQPLF
jgi:DNA polymerase-1